MSFTLLRFCIVLALLEIAYATHAICRAPHWDAFLIGDCPYYAATAESLVRDGDWDLSNQLPGGLENLKNHEGFFALSNDNRVVPKHSALLPILSIPFFILLGKFGFLVFNLLQIFVLMLGIVQLAGGGTGARLLALAAYLSTPLLAYTFNFSPDVLGAALIVWSYVCALRNRPILCGLLVGLAIWAKIYLAILALPLGLIIVPQGGRATIACVAAACVGVLPMLAINWHLFGSPFVTGYDRDARITLDGFAVTEHYSRFNQPLFAGLGRLLFDRDIGLLYTAPLWFIWPIGLLVCWRGASRPVRLGLAAMTCSLLLNLLFFARYDEWSATARGNRFLFPAVAIGMALQGPLWNRIVSRRRP